MITLSKKASSKLDGYGKCEIMTKEPEFFCFLATGKPGTDFTNLCIQANEVGGSGIYSVRIKPENMEEFLCLNEVYHVEWSRDMSYEAANMPAQEENMPNPCLVVMPVMDDTSTSSGCCGGSSQSNNTGCCQGGRSVTDQFLNKTSNIEE